MIQRVLLFDSETTSLDPKTGRVIEAAFVLWDVAHLTAIETFSGLCKSATNEALDVNGIPPGILVNADTDTTRGLVYQAAADADAVIAHNAAFDKSFCEHWMPSGTPWICSKEDFEWPRKSRSMSLTDVALAHGVPIIHPHRALADVLTLQWALERVQDLTSDVAQRLDGALARAAKPKKEFQALVSYDDREAARANGFRWSSEWKMWTRRMRPDDTAALPFKTREV